MEYTTRVFSKDKAPARRVVPFWASLLASFAPIVLFALTGTQAFAQGSAAGNAQSPGVSAPAATWQGKAAPSIILSPAERFARRAEILLNSTPANKGEWGILILDSASGEALFAKNPDSYFIPASNMKLFTTALALDQLGKDYRFHTTIETNGTMSASGVLIGDLVLVGRGDPNLSNRKFPFDTKEEFEGPPEKILAELADAVRSRGLKEIRGDIVGDDSYFPREKFPDGWEVGDIVWEFGAAISAIVVNDNTVSLTLSPGAKAGDAVAVEVQPPTGEFRVRNDVLTIAAKEKGELRLTREAGSELVVLSGTMPARSASRKLSLAVQEPSQQAANLLARLMADRGVKFSGTVRSRHEPDPSGQPRTILAEHLSLPLGDTVKLVNKISQNLHAEVLLRTAARQQGRWATPEELQKFPADFYGKAGIATDDVVQGDGSGLSRHDMVTPRAFVALLQYAQKQPWFAEYFASLPVAGVDGTLSDRLKDAGFGGRIHAKTGSLTHVRGLTGFADVPAANGSRRLVFSILTNNQAGKNHEAQQVIDGLCLAMMEEFGEESLSAK
jgi:D-alanyl-D-alanine carboxypeptidase/D-alanyl-D-alanine-endopeptidase (penicillin-binding protein 4)